MKMYVFYFLLVLTDAHLYFSSAYALRVFSHFLLLVHRTKLLPMKPTHCKAMALGGLLGGHCGECSSVGSDAPGLPPGQDTALQKEGTLPLGWPPLVQCQHRRAALRQEQNQSSAIHLTITLARENNYQIVCSILASFLCPI